jgi:hypothetical protein
MPVTLAASFADYLVSKDVSLVKTSATTAASRS